MTPEIKLIDGYYMFDGVVILISAFNGEIV